MGNPDWRICANIDHLQRLFEIIYSNNCALFLTAGNSLMTAWVILGCRNRAKLDDYCSLLPARRGIMPRYYFHLKSPSRPVRDKTGVELSGLEAAHWHAMRLVYRL